MPNLPQAFWNALRKAFGAYTRFNFACFSRAPVLAFYLVCLYYGWHILSNFNKDTTAITNAAFGIAAAFSGLSFAWSSTIQDAAEEKKRIAYCGERFFHAALLLILASILKYAVIALGPATFKDVRQLSDIGWRHCYTALLGGTALLLFFWALTFAHTGVIFVNRLLWKRINRYPDWDSWM